MTYAWAVAKGSMWVVYRNWDCEVRSFPSAREAVAYMDHVTATSWATLT